MSDESPEIVLWSGGAYPDREGIAVTPTAEGLVIAAWYDGGCGLEETVLLSWESIDAIRATVDQDP